MENIDTPITDAVTLEKNGSFFIPVMEMQKIEIKLNNAILLIKELSLLIDEFKQNNTNKDSDLSFDKNVTNINKTIDSIEQSVFFIKGLNSEEFQLLCYKNKNFKKLIDVCHDLCETSEALGY